MRNVTQQDIVGDVLSRYPDAARFFIDIGMHCLGCPSARGETIEEACRVHGADCASLLDRINGTPA